MTITCAGMISRLLCLVGDLEAKLLRPSYVARKQNVVNLEFLGLLAKLKV